MINFQFNLQPKEKELQTFVSFKRSYLLLQARYDLDFT